ncbi:hypothetical protein GXW74_18650 [Roseomonas eburnea]|uniref:Uncharacterized protein n=1 Tax=Neoroseomonas eburnea TaxID=1346889 RepID=A0A9X9XFN2_9PROT|nr:hypothetical protein [Neoroseomonas eburnea]MBR0682518.1 hypothetical protein [Neoroseomonas eburnea]
MSDTGTFDRRSIEAIYRRGGTPEGGLAIALGVIAILIGLSAIGAGAWLAYGNVVWLFALPGGLPAAEAQTISVYLVACGALTTLLGALSIYKSQDM